MDRLHRRHDRQVRAGSANLRFADFGDVLPGQFLLHRIQALVLEEENGVVVADRGLEQSLAPLRVEPYRRFVASHSRFVVYGRYRAWDWLTSALQASGADTHVIARNSQNGAPLVEVRRP